MEENNTRLGLPGNKSLEAGEDSAYGKPVGSNRYTRVSPESPEPGVQERLKDRHERLQDVGSPVMVIPEKMVGRPIWRQPRPPPEGTEVIF